jgi:hypothetical protein
MGDIDPLGGHTDYFASLPSLDDLQILPIFSWSTRHFPGSSSSRSSYAIPAGLASAPATRRPGAVARCD